MKKKLLIGFGSLLLASIALLLLSLGGVYFASSRGAGKVWEVPKSKVVVANTPEAIAAGKHLVDTIAGCTDCHAENLGGKVMIDSFPTGIMAPPNITKGGKTAQYTDEDWARVIRHGVKPNKHSVFFMPSHELNHLSDEDVGNIIAYLKTFPSIDQQQPASYPGPLFRVLYLAGQISLYPAEMIDHQAPHTATAPSPEAKTEFGAYMVKVCIGCHGEGLSGGPIPGLPPDFPPSKNITPHESGLKNWTEADFIKAMREGIRPDGSKIDPFMPYKAYGKLSDDELSSMWAYLQTVPAKAYGGR